MHNLQEPIDAVVDDQFTFEAKELRVSLSSSSRCFRLPVAHGCRCSAAVASFLVATWQRHTNTACPATLAQVTFVAGEDIWALKFGSPGAFERFLQKYNKARCRGGEAGLSGSFSAQTWIHAAR